MKIVSIDYGKARIGMAKSDALGMLASPIGTIHEKNFRIQLKKVAEIIGRDWYFSNKTFVEFKNNLERRIKWEYSGETEVLILQNNGKAYF